MNCPHCEAGTAVDAKFCQSCGKPLTGRADGSGNSPCRHSCAPQIGTASAVLAASHRQSGEVVSTTGTPARHGRPCRLWNGSSIRRTFRHRSSTARDEIVVQGKRKPNLMKRAFGLDQAVTVVISVEGKDMKTVVGGAKWIDKAAGAAIGWFVFFPAIFTAGWGVYKQKQLFSRLEKEIDAFLGIQNGEDRMNHNSDSSQHRVLYGLRPRIMNIPWTDRR